MRGNRNSETAIGPPECEIDEFKISLSAERDFERKIDGKINGQGHVGLEVSHPGLSVDDGKELGLGRNGQNIPLLALVKLLMRNDCKINYLFIINENYKRTVAMNGRVVFL